jgi:ribonucleoside-diphosphate reductase alpha chain
MAKEGSTVGGLMDVVGTCVSMSLQYGVPLITLIDKFRHARFEPAGMTSNKNIPFAKSLIDYIFCWMGCQFIPGYAEKNTPNRTPAAPAPESKTNTTAKQLVQKTQDLAKKIDEAKSLQKKQPAPAAPPKPQSGTSPVSAASGRFGRVADRAVEVVASVISNPDGTQAAAMGQFNEQFNHFQDDAPACDVCGSICVRNGTCYRCFNCGNSMGCS